MKICEHTYIYIYEDSGHIMSSRSHLLPQLPAGPSYAWWRSLVVQSLPELARNLARKMALLRAPLNEFHSISIFNQEHHRFSTMVSICQYFPNNHTGCHAVNFGWISADWPILTWPLPVSPEVLHEDVRVALLTTQVQPLQRSREMHFI